MATHRLTHCPGESGDVGNSMSTSFRCEHERLIISWRDREKSFPAKEGEEFLISCEGGFPKVVRMMPPSDPVARVGWEYRFYKGKRYKSRETLKENAKKHTRFDRPRGYEVPAVVVFESENCAVAYMAAMEGQRGVPWGWYASSEATPLELETLIRECLGMSALHVFGRG